MNQIENTIKRLKTEWSNPSVAIHRGNKCPFLLSCKFDPEPSQKINQINKSLPEDVRMFWSETRTAVLFKDFQFGQWGVEIFSPESANTETIRQIEIRSSNIKNEDLVIARFYGDSDILILNCNPASSKFGEITLGLPIESRSKWPVIASSFTDFLTKFTYAQGDKYWE